MGVYKTSNIKHFILKILLISESLNNLIFYTHEELYENNVT